MKLYEHIDAFWNKIVAYKINNSNAVIVDDIGFARAVENFII